MTRRFALAALLLLAALTLALWLSLGGGGTEPQAREPKTVGMVPLGPSVPRTPDAVPMTKVLTLDAAFHVTVKGRAVDGAGRPLAGVGVAIRASVESGWLDDGHADAPLAETQTATDGGFALRVPRRDALVLSLSHPRLPPVVLSFPAPAPGGERVLGDIELRTGLGLLVDVKRRTDQRAVAGARVAASMLVFDPFLGGAAPRRLAVTDADGHAVLYGLPAGDWRVRVEADGFASAEREHHQAAELRTAPGIQIALDPGHSLAGRVLGPRGDPVADALVTLVPDAQSPVTTSLRTGVGGEFRALGLPAGVIRVRAEATQTSAVCSQSVVLPRDDRLDLRLEAGFALAGRVVEIGSALPLAGVDVEARSEDGSPLVRAGRIARATTRTDGEGSFRVEGLPPGRFRLFFTSERHAPGQSDALESQADPPSDATFLLRPAPEVEVSVMDSAGRPLPGAEVEMLPADHQGTALSEMLCRAAGGSHRARATTDARGIARLPVTAPRFRLWAHTAGHADMLGPIESTPPDLARFAAPALRLGDGCSLSGTVRDAEGNPLGGVVLRADPEPRTAAMYVEVRSTADGRFAFPPRAPGAHVVSAWTDDGRSSAPQRIMLREGQGAPLEVQLR